MELRGKEESLRPTRDAGTARRGIARRRRGFRRSLMRRSRLGARDEVSGDTLRSFEGSDTGLYVRYSGRDLAVGDGQLLTEYILDGI